MFPQIHRATVIGMCNIIARSFTIMAPLVNEYPEPIPMLVIMILVTIGLLNSFTLQLQPESHFNNQQQEMKADKPAPVQPPPVLPT